MSSSLSTNIVVGRKQWGRRIKRGHHRDRGKTSRSADLLLVVPVCVAELASTCNQREGVEFRSEAVRPCPKAEPGELDAARACLSPTTTRYPLHVQSVIPTFSAMPGIQATPLRPLRD
ncbi:hypothetical protein D9611_008301 [Ephemerocybe angulata]|uniref:Uncharacterized protein n=1 Tax=Ephemerocybe angulata TaxID=980116 RepID=A0A8H5BKW2_9AGAR|nr:hypothetical protein D9611_008301 [Tulosesus angulatus]